MLLKAYALRGNRHHEQETFAESERLGSTTAEAIGRMPQAELSFTIRDLAIISSFSFALFLVGKSSQDTGI